MKLHLSKTNNNPFEVPEGNYIGTFFRYRTAKKAFCSCALDQQLRFDFALLDTLGNDEGYIGSATVCKTKRCDSQPHSIRQFLETWLGDQLYDFVDSGDNIELDSLLGRKADVQIIEKPTKGHSQPYSKLERAVPRGILIPL